VVLGDSAGRGRGDAGKLGCGVRGFMLGLSLVLLRLTLGLFTRVGISICALHSQQDDSSVEGINGGGGSGCLT